MSHEEVMPTKTIELDVKKATSAELVAFYNKHSGSSKPIKKFADRQSAEKRVAELIKANNELATGTSKKSEAKKAAKAGKAPKGESTGKRGRKGDATGKTIHRVGEWKTKNPRREGTRAFRVWNLIKDGMTYEAYMAAGGDSRDLMHEAKRGRVTLK